MIMKKWIHFLTLVLGVCGSVQARTWTSSDGKKLEAEFVSVTETEVSLKRDSDGKLFTLPLERLSELDQEFIEEKGEEMPEEDSDETASMEPVTGDYAHLVTGDWVLAEHENLPYSFYGGKSIDGSKKYPLVVSLHGKSDNNENGKQQGQARSFLQDDNYTKRPCLVLAPLCYQPHGAT